MIKFNLKCDIIMNGFFILMTIVGVCLLVYAIDEKRVVTAIFAVALIVVGGKVLMDEDELQRKGINQYLLKKPFLPSTLTGQTATHQAINGQNAEGNVNLTNNRIQPAASTETFNDFFNSDYVKNMPYGGYPDWMFYDMVMDESFNTAPESNSEKEYKRINAINHYNDLVNTKNSLEPTSVLHSSYTEMIINQRELINSLGGW